jgi:nitric oxide reductase activation protein
MARAKRTAKVSTKINYSSRSAYGNSSFWLDDTKTDKLYTHKGVDIVAMAGYKRAISNFVRIVTGKSDIDVDYSSDKESYTDGKSIVISSKLNEKNFDCTVGLALHEASHIALTDFSWQTDLGFYDRVRDFTIQKSDISPDFYEIRNRIKILVNIIEDRRIDNFIYTTSPGYQGYYQSMYKTYFDAPVIDSALIATHNGKRLSELIPGMSLYDEYEFHICNFVNPNRNLDALPGLRDIWNMISLKTISRLKSTQDVASLAFEVYARINNELLNESDNTPNLDNSAQKDTNGNEESNNNTEANSNNNTEANSNNNTDSNNNTEANSNNNTDSNSNTDSNNNTDSDSNSNTSSKKSDQLQKAVDRQKDFLEGKVRKSTVTKDTLKKVKALSSSNANLIDTDYESEQVLVTKNKCMLVRGWDNVLLESRLLNAHYDKYYLDRNADAVSKGLALGKMLGKKLKTRDEDVSLTTSRLDKGQIDRRLIAEIGFNNSNVFKQTVHTTSTPSYVHISIDASGSMSGKKWQNALITAIAIAKAASMTSSIECCISIRGDFGQTGYQYPLMWVVYDSAKDKLANFANRAKALHCNAATPEGLCFDAIRDDLIKSAKGKDAYFINISDGAPQAWYSSINYSGQAALDHTKRSVLTIKQTGIKVASFFVSDVTEELRKEFMEKYACEPMSIRNFRYMYGKDSEIIDLTNLMELAKSLNTLFIRK